MLHKSHKNYLKKTIYPKSNVSGVVDVIPPVKDVFPFLNFKPKLEPDLDFYLDFSGTHNNAYDFPISSGNEWIWLGEDGYEFESMPPLEPIPGVVHQTSFDSDKSTETGLIHSGIERETEKGNSEKKVLVDKPVHQPELTFKNDLCSKRKPPECVYASDKRRFVESNGENQVSSSTCSSVEPKEPKSVRISSKVNGNSPSKSSHLNVSASNTTLPKEQNERSPIHCISFNNASDLQAFASAMLNKKSRIVLDVDDSSDVEKIKHVSDENLLEDSSKHEVNDGKKIYPVIFKPLQADLRCSIRQVQKKCKSVTSKTQTGDHELKPKRSRRTPKPTISRIFVPEKICYLASDLDSPDEEEIKEDPNETFLKISSMYQVIDGKVCDPVVPKLPKADPKPSMLQAQKSLETTIKDNRQKVKSRLRPSTTSKSTSFRNFEQGKIPLDLDSLDEDEIKHDSSKILLENSIQYEVIDGKECDPFSHKLSKSYPKPAMPPVKKSNKSLETKALNKDNRRKFKSGQRPDTTSKPTTYRNFSSEKIPFIDSDFADSSNEDYEYDSSETISEYSFPSKSEEMKSKEKDQQVDSEPRRSLRIHLRGYMKQSEMGGTCSEMHGEPVRRLKS